MELQLLKQRLARPEVHAKILSGYHGRYSLGIGMDPKEHFHIVVLQLSDPRAREAFDFPSFVDLGDESLPVVIRTNLGTPRSLATG